MNNKVLILLLGLSLLNCKKNPTTDNPPPAPTEITSDSASGPEVQSARNSLDYLGTYKGTLPCADCQGIETSLELSEDFTYVMTSRYLGRSAKMVETKGTFSWNDDETSIVLTSTNGSSRYAVGDHALTQLDMGGKKIAGKLADMYVLKKIPEAEAAKTDAATPKQAEPEIIGIRWKLVELNGKPIKNDNPVNDYYIEFQPENNFKGFAGCNKINGHYENKGNLIHFMRIVGTMKGCANMETEEDFKEVLETVNNFIRNDKILQFRRGENFLAKFEALPGPKK